MIRKITEQEKLEGQASEELYIKRRFVPIELTIAERGQYRTFKEKIPYGTRKVAGIVITHDAPDHKMHHNRIYVGSAPDTHIDQGLVCGLKDDLIGNEAVTYQVEVGQGEKLYFAQPKRLSTPELKLNGYYWKFKHPVVITLRDFWTDFHEDYCVWESRYTGWGIMNLCVKPGVGDDPDEYEEEL